MYLPSCSNAYDDITDFEIFGFHKNTKIRISVFGPEITPSLDTFHAVNLTQNIIMETIDIAKNKR